MIVTITEIKLRIYSFSAARYRSATWWLGTTALHCAINIYFIMIHRSRKCVFCQLK